MGKYKLWNLILGWGSFAIALVVYSLTMEPTVSFWDCGEFIASANGLQVGHPPGAPLFAMMGRVFALMASDPGQVALMINFMSATVSALTIAFLFWTVTALARKVIVSQGQEHESPFNMLAILGSGLLGALAYTFSDTFWFSAVEGEVYATSSLFTAVVFWAILRWEQVADEPHADRWIVLIAYIMGLSIGIHLLNLLTIPAIGLIYYFRKYKTVKPIGVIVTLAVSMGILLFVQYGIIPGTISLIAGFERTFVNSYNMGFGSGFFAFVIFTFLLLGGGIFYTMRKGYPKINLAIWSVFVILIGYSSYGMILIRSMANPPMDENNPENVYSLISYLNREQYGDRPLMKGQYYDARVTGTKSGGNVMIKSYQVVDGAEVKGDFTIEKDALDFIEANKSNGNLKIRNRYVKTDEKIKYTYDPSRSTFFPRMWSGEGRHRAQYESWGGVTPGGVPNFKNNITFFIDYQVKWMYMRYFMWNFAGRENDMQGNGESLNGHWISGFKFVDSYVAGTPQSDLPRALSENKGRNKYFFIPLLLGILGLVWQFRKDWKGASVVFALFFLTGLAIVIYLNQTPMQPRERDYAYAGSFYAFAIWIGLAGIALLQFFRKLDRKDWQVPIILGGSGLLLTLIGLATGNAGLGLTVLILGAMYSAFMFLASLLSDIIPKRVAGGALMLAFCILAGPIWMGYQNWDDHNRSKRYTARDFAYNYLNSCAPNAILFTNGDNDTFPLWYLQEVEQVRRDVRIVNLSLLNTDWYITQMKRKAYEGMPVPFSFSEPLYRQGQRDAVLITNSSKRQLLRDAMNFIKLTDGRNVDQGSELKFFQTNKFSIPVDSAEVVGLGLVPADKMGSLVKSIDFDLPMRKDEPKKVTYLNQLMILDLLDNLDWNRPIYFSMTVGQEYYEYLGDYLKLEGLAYRLVPYRTGGEFGSIEKVDSEKTYDLLMNTFRWGNLENRGLYLDETNMRMVNQFQMLFMQTAAKMQMEGKNAKAIELLDRCMDLTPDETVPMDFRIHFNMVRMYAEMKEYDKAELYGAQLQSRLDEMVNYLAPFASTDKSVEREYQGNLQYQAGLIGLLAEVAKAKAGKPSELDLPMQPDSGAVQNAPAPIDTPKKK